MWPAKSNGAVISQKSDSPTRITRISEKLVTRAFARSIPNAPPGTQARRFAFIQKVKNQMKTIIFFAVVAICAYIAVTYANAEVIR